ncbi:hypothetical protein BOTBODRAFT_105670 [Botryobasidium botryosum FD-172 SS1]|uniref:Glucose-methanol-choline oxidoreductase N-terminal domain-containing protein n=1 Tax=Botryobasidium botryosum (strain FD-172 SS1) TaxID=930990 RepID=A0A067MPQ2_BOTB1|nr:hypothetical protein BOTBODRAFT_105670 [Botryobasidium botryosum FD-172 SS1]
MAQTPTSSSDSPDGLKPLNIRFYGVDYIFRLSKKSITSRYRKPGQVGTIVETDEVLERDGQADTANEYDVVIIGGGTAGCVLASRLSERADIRVLLLEVGKSSTEVLASRAPAGYMTLMRGPCDHKLETAPQVNCFDRKIYWPRGKFLGGCSGMNAAICHHGSPSDYDEWAVNTDPGAEDWKYENFKKYVLQSEIFTPHSSAPVTKASEGKEHAGVQIGYSGHYSNAAAKWHAACEALGIPMKENINASGDKLVTYIDPKGRRSTTESGYLTREVLLRPNLTVVVGAKVTKIVFDDDKNQPRAVGVDFRKESSGPVYRVCARKEVILSAGAIHTPQILMLSGVGPAEQLALHGITLIHHLPGVGSSLRDHPWVVLRFRAKKNESLSSYLEPELKHDLKRVFGILQWFLRHNGPLTTNVPEAAAFVRATDPVLFAALRDSIMPEDSTSGPDSPDLELIISPGCVKNLGGEKIPTGGVFGLGVALLRPTSVGTIKLRSSNPTDPPIIDPNYFNTQHDLDVLVRGLRIMLEIVKTEPFASVIVHTDTHPDLDHGLDKLSDDELKDIIRRRVETVFHPVGTAKMAPLNAGGVVDPYLRVHGIPNLRIVDASIMPTIISGHTVTPVIAIAEKAADMIRGCIVKT